MRTVSCLSAVMMLLSGCARETSATKAKAEHSHGARSGITRWTPQGELFIEHGALVAGEPGEVLIHLTRANSFKPDGEATVALHLGAFSIEAEKTQTPGVYDLDFIPGRAGKQALSVTWNGQRHDLGEIEVFADDASIKTKAPGEGVRLLKEQQWTLDFATAIVAARPMRANLRVPAEIVARAGGESEVTAPFSGRLVAANVPDVGTRVTKGQILGGLLPPTSMPSDLPTLDLALAEANAALDLAKKDAGRAQRLVAVGAVPQRRLDEARTVEATATARVDAAKARLSQYEETRSAEGETKRSRQFLLRAPIDGIIAEVHATPGANIEAGKPVFHILDIERVYVRGIAPESDIPLLRNLTGAELDMGPTGTRRAGRLVSVGNVVDPSSRTVNVLYEIDNRDRALAVGQSLFLRLFLASRVDAPVLPLTAVIDDGGRQVVFIQKEGELFERRLVQTGTQEEGVIQILGGIKTGERAVVKGAYLVRLAASSSQVPTEGHTH